MTTLSNLTATLGVVAGCLIVGYDTDWYLIAHHDPSQFIAFAIAGFGLITLSIILNAFYQRIVKMQKTIDYFEDNLLDRFPELKGE